MRNNDRLNSWNLKIWIIITLSTVLSLGLVGCARGIFSEPTETPTPIPPTESPLPPLPTDTPRPSLTPVPTATGVLQTSTPDLLENCISFEALSESHVGNIVCVYGAIVQRLSGSGYAAVLRFSESNDHFLFRSLSYYWSGVEIGDCIYVMGEIQWNGAYYYIEIDEQGEGAEVGYSDQCQ